MPAAPCGTAVIPHGAGTFGDRSQGCGPAPDSSPPGPLEAAVGAAGAVELVQRPHVLIRELKRSAEADGNRTRLSRATAHTGFEDQKH
jgi:hypothetical protein